MRSGVRSSGSLRGSGLRVLRPGLWLRELLQVQVPPRAALPKLLPVSELLFGPGLLRPGLCGSGPGPLRSVRCGSLRRSGLLCSGLPELRPDLLQVQVQVP